MSNRIYLAAAIGCLSLQAAMPAAADDSKCCLRLTPYYWAVGIDGSIEDNRGSTTDQVDFNNDIGDITDNLEFNGSLMLEHNAGHWVNFAALDYMKVDNNDTGLVTMTGNRVKMETDTTLLTAATGYRFGTGEGSHVDLMVGVRYAKLGLLLLMQSLRLCDGDRQRRADQRRRREHHGARASRWARTGHSAPRCR